MSVVLIVDDSPTELHLFQKMLEKAGFDTLVADSGEEGVRQARQAKPDCILMDVVMPGLNGFQATRQIRQEPSSAHIPIIIVSGEQQATEQLWGKRVGANGFLTKPVDRGEFFRQIFEVLGEDTFAIN
jgi:twitching motility two-component system response regulator PilH